MRVEFAVRLFSNFAAEPVAIHAQCFAEYTKVGIFAARYTDTGKHELAIMLARTVRCLQLSE